ncbi:MAG: hypothetical protein PHY32_03105 [Candidatus Pacebacteria bacterium]|nr:hypothetical protein [Candidatus Paceibacterota bacterium]
MAKKENKFIKAVTYVDYKTNEITGSHFGQEHDERKTVTTDKITIGGGDGSSPLTVTLSVDKEKINCNERVTITASVNNKSNCTLSSSNDLNQSPDSN